MNIKMTDHCCAICGIAFSFPQAWYEEKLTGQTSDARAFWCPNGHKRYWVAGYSKNDKLRRELEMQKQQNAMLAQEAIDERERRLATERSLRSTKAAKTLLKRRVGAGKCPCCSEHFPNLELHMKKQHPDGKVVPMRKAV